MPHPKVKISDNSGNTVDVTESNELKVKLSDSVTVTATDLSVELDHTNDSVQLWGNESAAGSGTARALLTDSDGHLQVDVLSATGGEVENEPVQSEPLLIGGRYDSSARTLNAGDAGAIALSASGHVLTAISDGTEVANVTSNNELEVSLNNIDGAAGTMIVKQAIIPTATNTKASVGTGSTEITAAVPTRYSIDIVNDSDEVVYLGLEDAAVLNEGIRLNPNGGSYSSNTFTGAIYGIAAATANVTAAWTH